VKKEEREGGGGEIMLFKRFYTTWGLTKTSTGEKGT